MATTPPPDDDEGCSECYMLGVLFALAGSSFQALGLSLWKLHHVRTEKAEAERLARIRAREDRVHQYNKAPIPDDASSASNNKHKDDHSEITEDSCTGSHAGETRLSVKTGKDGKPLSDIDEEEEDEHERKGPCAGVSGVWLVGFIIFAVGNGGDFIALGITKQSVVTLVGSWALVVNTFTARCLLHEIVHPLDILSSCLIIAGIVLTVLFSGQDSPEWPLDRIVAQYQKPPVVIMLIILASMVLFGLTVMHLDYVKRRKEAEESKTVIAKPSRAIGALYCVVGSLVADFTVLFGKAFSGLLLPTLQGDNQFTSPFVVLIVLVFCVSLPSQIYLIDQSLTVNDALYHIPNFYVFWNVGSIVTGAIYYEEMANFELANWLGFFSGVGVLFLGVYLTNIAAAKKQALMEAKEQRRSEEEWMGGAGNEDGLHTMYDEEAKYQEMWEQEAEKGAGREKEAVTEIDYRGEEQPRGRAERPDSAYTSAGSLQGSLRDVTLGEAGSAQRRELLFTPETVEEGDEAVMANLMRTLRDATGSDDADADADTPEHPRRRGGAGRVEGESTGKRSGEGKGRSLWGSAGGGRRVGSVAKVATESMERAAEGELEEVGWVESPMASKGKKGKGKKGKGKGAGRREAEEGLEADSSVSPSVAEAILVGDLPRVPARPFDPHSPAEGGLGVRGPAGAGVVGRKGSVAAEERSGAAAKAREIALWRRRSLRQQGARGQGPSLLDVSWGQEGEGEGSEGVASAKVPGRVLSEGGAGAGAKSGGRKGGEKGRVGPKDWRDAQGSWLEERRRQGAHRKHPPGGGARAARGAGAGGGSAVPPHNMNGGRGRGAAGGAGAARGVESSPVSYLVQQFSGSGRMPKWYNQDTSLSPTPTKTNSARPSPARPSPSASRKPPAPKSPALPTSPDGVRLFSSPETARSSPRNRSYDPSRADPPRTRTIGEATRRIAEKRRTRKAHPTSGSDSDASL